MSDKKRRPETENEKKTKSRILLLEKYFNSIEFKKEKEKLDSKNNIPDGYEIRNLLPHVGSKYDCVQLKNGNSFRIVIMGLEALDEKGYDIKKRTEQIQILAADEPFEKRNPHMKGTTVLLKFILKDICGMDVEGESIKGNHIFKYFSLSNWYLHGCFLVGKNKAYRKLVKPEMAAKHFVETMKKLKPTLVILQGKSIYFGDAFTKYNMQSKDQYCWEYYSETCKDYIVFQPTCDNILGFPVIRFLHPSQRGKNRWISKDDKYFKDTIIPVLQKLFNLKKDY